MYIHRDITQLVSKNSSWVQILLGPRQCGKSTLFSALMRESEQDPALKEITFDDLALRQLANRDPALFLEQFPPPLLLDEIQYAPNLLPEIKRQIDVIKKDNLFGATNIKQTVLYRMTGSNQIELDKHAKESLAGRTSYFHLNTLSVHEILNAMPQTSIGDILFKGGWPELYTNTQLSCTTYLNDYIRSYVEKDIVISAGIQKVTEFHSVLGLLAARTGQLTDDSAVAKDSGVSSVTINDWAGLLERSNLIYYLKPYHSNLSKRLIKSPKLYFWDTGLATRLQGWNDPKPLWTSPQAGALFETLVLSEIIKFINNYQKDWQLFFWRTKEGEEIDFIIQTAANKMHAFDAKLAMQNKPEAATLPPSFQKHFSTSNPLVLVTFGGQRLALSKQCMSLPIAELHDYLSNIENT